MCGIAGILDQRTSGERLAAVVRDMSACIAHRGPDADDVWADVAAGVALGHRRLAILDLSPTGEQPMSSATGRYVVVFNGEIYNYPDVRAELERAHKAPRWRGRSDTEVMLAAFEAWGVRPALERLNGMFALGLWDTRERTLYLARDRMGEKPLYYGWFGHTFAFASELKAMRRCPGWADRVDRAALALYIRHNYIPAPWSIFEGIRKLPPATFLAVRPEDRERRAMPSPEEYWSLPRVALEGVRQSARGLEEHLTELDARLREAVRIRMFADVPLGAFLSGGIDSSLVVALMQAQSTLPVRTFSIGFSEADYNEANYARAVARHLGTEHVDLTVTPSEARDVIPTLPMTFDEPFGDSSQIPTCLVAKLARSHVAVALSGDGGDELFAGYNRYAWAERLWGRFGRIPLPVRRAIGGSLRLLSPAQWDALAGAARSIVPALRKVRRVGDNVWKLTDVLDVAGPREMYRELVSHHDAPEALVLGAREHDTILSSANGRFDGLGLVEEMMLLDQLTYLPDDILVKVDRAAMAVSLEGRIPFLDPHVIELAWRLPMGVRIRQGKGKWILRQLLRRHLPEHLYERPKMGFGVPIGDWLRSDLRDWAEMLLDPRRLSTEGFFDVAEIRRDWSDHLASRRNRQYHLWNILMFQAWLSAVAEEPVARGIG